MSRELLASQKNNSGILLDPRTKLAVLITIAVFILGGSYEGIMQYYIIVLAAIPLLLLSAARKWKGAVLYILIFGGSLCLEMFGLSRLAGVANYIAVAIVGILLRFTPSVVMGYFVVTTTTVSEFVAAMERLHLPQQITIPVESIFVREEYRRQGVAAALHGKAEEIAASYGNDTVYNYVHPNNHRMIEFLRKRGYTVLNLIEIRKPYQNEKLTQTITVGEHEFDY